MIAISFILLVRSKMYGSEIKNSQRDGRQCQKKLIQGADGWSCETCNKYNWMSLVTFRTTDTPDYRYIFSMEVMDHTGSQYVQLFNNEGEAFFGIEAEEMKALSNTNKSEYEDMFKNRLFKEYIMTLRVKFDQPSSRVRCTVHHLYPVDENKEVDDMIAIIENMSLYYFCLKFVSKQCCAKPH